MPRVRGLAADPKRAADLLPARPVASRGRDELTLDAELELEGRVYDLIHILNGMRKEQGLELTDRITVTLPEADAELIERHADWIKAEVLAVSLDTGGVAEPRIAKV